MPKEISATGIIAFAVVELNTPLPYEVLLNMSPTDPLYLALVDAWKDKQEREDRRTALLCSVLANVMGSGKKQYKVEDFMPKRQKSIKEQEAEVRAGFLKYEEYRKAKINKNGL